MHIRNDDDDDDYGLQAVRKAVEEELGIDIKALGLKAKIKELVMKHYEVAADVAAEEASAADDDDEEEEDDDDGDDEDEEESDEEDEEEEEEEEEDLRTFLTPKYAKAYVQAHEVAEEGETSPRSFWGKIAWVKVSGYPWWACYVCDPTQVRFLNESMSEYFTIIMLLYEIYYYYSFAPEIVFCFLTLLYD